MFKDACALVSYPRSNIKYAMVIGADNSQAAPRGCPGGELDAFRRLRRRSIHLWQTRRHRRSRRLVQLHIDTPDFWRRDGEPYPMHGGRFTGDPAYLKHVRKAATKLMERQNLKAIRLKLLCASPAKPDLPSANR